MLHGGINFWSKSIEWELWLITCILPEVQPEVINSDCIYRNNELRVVLEI